MGNSNNNEKGPNSSSAEQERNNPLINLFWMPDNLEEPQARNPDMHSEEFSFLEHEALAVGGTAIDIKTNQLNLGFKSLPNFVIGWFFMLMMIVCNSLIAPLTLSIKAESVLIKISWRTQSTTLLSFLLAMVGYLCSGRKRNPIMDIWNNLSIYFWTGFTIFFWNFGFILGASMTVTSHAAILYSSTAIYLFLFSFITCKYVHSLWKVGFVMYLIGGYFMISDPFAHKTESNGPSLLGDLICFASAGVGAIWMIYCWYIPAETPLMTRNFGAFLFAVVGQFLVLPWIIGFGKYYSMHPTLGAFGWLGDTENFLVVFFGVALVSGVLGNLGFFAAFQYFPAEIISGFLLIEPVFAQTAGILLKQDEIPGIKTLIGGAIITVGLFVYGYGEKQKSNKEEKEKADLKEEENRLSELSELKH